jgi:hypothetical protein
MIPNNNNTSITINTSNTNINTNSTTNNTTNINTNITNNNNNTTNNTSTNSTTNSSKVTGYAQKYRYAKVMQLRASRHM